MKTSTRVVPFVVVPALLALLIVLALVGTRAIMAASNASVPNFKQCANGAPPSTSTACPSGWINGILQASNSHYAEDQATAQRAILDIPTGGNLIRTVTLEYQSRKATAHAYDSLASWDVTQTTANACQSLTAADFPGCSAPYTNPGRTSTIPSGNLIKVGIPDDPASVTPTGAGGNGSAVTTTHMIPAGADRQFTIIGSALDTTYTPTFSAYTHIDSGGSDQLVDVTITYKVTSLNTKVMLLWGGHLASGADALRGWGTGFGSSSISGGPYHMKIIKTDGASVGNRDNQISSSAILVVAPGLTTTASGPVTVGQTITDTAHLSGGNNPTGTISFQVFAPGDTTCSTPLTPALTPATVNGNGDYTSGPFTTSAVGTYRWIASYSGDGNNIPVSTLCNDANESSTVDKDTPTLTTTASGPVIVGSNITDTAHLSGGFAPLGGSITFDVFAPGDTTCSTPLTPAPTGATVSGAGDYTSGPFTTSAVGTYRWIAHYSGDANNNAVNTACNDANESSTVNPPPIIMSTAQDLLPNDSATITNGFNPTGTITFSLFSPSDPTCSGNAAYTETVTVTGNGPYSTTNGTIHATDVGTWNWLVDYDGDANNPPITIGCGVENFTIVNG